MRRLLAPLVVLCLLAVAPASQAITRSQATAVALKAVRAQQGDRPIVVFALPRPLRARSRVIEAGPGPSRRGRVTRTADQEVFTPNEPALRRRAWLFWADLAPRARFQHPSTLVLVDDRSGRVVRRRAMSWYPLVDGRVPAFLRPAGYESKRYRVFARDPVRPAARAAAPVAPRAWTAQASIAGPPDVRNDCLVHIGDLVEVGNFGGDFAATEQMAKTLGLRRAVAGDARGLVDALRRFNGANPKCVDAVIWISAHGYPATGSNFPHPNGGTIPESANAQVGLKKTVTTRNGRQVVVSSTLDSRLLRRILAAFPDMTFKLVVDACFSGRWVEMADVPNLRVILAAARSDQMAFGYTPNGTSAITVQRNAVMTTPGGTATVNVTNIKNAGGFTSAIVFGINAWGASGEARQQTNEDLGKALALSFTQSPTQNANQILGMTAPQMNDQTSNRPHAPVPAAQPAPGGGGAGGGGGSNPPPSQTSYTVTAAASYRHGPPPGPGGAPSEVCVEVSTSPARSGGSARVRVTGPGVVAGGDQTVTLDGSGKAFVRVGINQYGDYTAGADVKASDGAERSGAGQVTVDGDPGTCPAP